MPIITLNLLRELVEKNNRPATTEEIINHVADISPRNLENLVPNIMVLEKAGFIRKSFDKKRNSYVWELSNPNLNGREMLETYPELYEQSLYGEESLNGILKRKRKS